MTSILLKYLEKLIRRRICEHLIVNNLFDAEHVFIRKKSRLTVVCWYQAHPSSRQRKVGTLHHNGLERPILVEFKNPIYRDLLLAVSVC